MPGHTSPSFRLRLGCERTKCGQGIGPAEILVESEGLVVAKKGSAKPLYVGSIPTRASSISSWLLDFTGTPFTSTLRPRSAAMEQNRADSTSGVRVKVRQQISGSIRPLDLSSFVPRHLSRFVPEHSTLLALIRPVNVTLHDADRIVLEYFRKGRQVDPFFGHACGKGVAEVVENKIQRGPAFCACPQGRSCALFTLATCRPGFRLDGNIYGDSLPSAQQDPAALRGETELSSRSPRFSFPDVHSPMLQVDIPPSRVRGRSEKPARRSFRGLTGGRLIRGGTPSPNTKELRSRDPIGDVRL
jgi:hypothetical protein